MKSLGRLLVATALILPAGILTVQNAGATPPNTATCTGNTGTLHLVPGVRASNPVGQTINNGTDGRLDGCSGVGIAGTTGGAFKFTIKGAAATCSSIRGKTYAGPGSIKWDADGSNANVTTKLQVKVKFLNYTNIQFSGTVSSPYLRGTHLSGKATIPDTLKPVGVGGGACQNKTRVKSLAYTNSGDTTL